MRRTTAIAAALAAVMLAAPACASAFEFTHRLKITVEYKYDWSISPNDSCGRSGSGFFHEKASTKSVRVRPGYDRAFGRFVIAVPYGKRGVRDMKHQQLLGSYELANNAPYVGQDCPSHINTADSDRGDCGIKPLPKRAVAGYTDSDRSKFQAVVGGLVATPFDNHCAQIDVFDWNELFTKRLFIKVPSARKLAKSSVTVKGSQTTHPDLSREGVGTGTATRTVRFAFTKL